LVPKAIHYNRKNKEEGMTIKMDMANAFNWIYHSFLFDVIHKFGFVKPFILWVKSYLYPLGSRPSEWQTRFLLQ
jgi:hypothetical protein